MILGVMFLLRIYRVFVGGPHARQIFYVPFWSIALVEGPVRRSAAGTSS